MTNDIDGMNKKVREYYNIIDDLTRNKFYSYIGPQYVIDVQVPEKFKKDCASVETFIGAYKNFLDGLSKELNAIGKSTRKYANGPNKGRPESKAKNENFRKTLEKNYKKLSSSKGKFENLSNRMLIYTQTIRADIINFRNDLPEDNQSLKNETAEYATKEIMRKSVNLIYESMNYITLDLIKINNNLSENGFEIVGNEKINENTAEKIVWFIEFADSHFNPKKDETAKKHQR